MAEVFAFLSKRRIAGGTGNLLFFDSFDHYSLAQINRKWTSANPTALVTGRTNTGAEVGNLNRLFKTLDNEYTALCTGFAFKPSGFANPILSYDNVRLGSPTCVLQFLTDGRMEVIYGNPSAGGSSTVIPGFVAQAGAWYYLEMSLSASASGGTATATVSFWLNGGSTPLLNAATLTAPYSSSTLNYADVSIDGGFAGSIVDDVYITDGENLGDIRIYCIFPNAAGDVTQWTANPGPNNYAMVNENPADDGTTTVSTATATDEDLYNLQDIAGFTGTIKGLQALWCAQKSDGGAASFKGELKSSGTTVQTAEFFPSYASWLYFIKPYRKSPFTSADWGVSEVNALQQGQIRIS